VTSGHPLTIIFGFNKVVVVVAVSQKLWKLFRLVKPFMVHLYLKMEKYIGEQGWCSGESACLPPMWPGFNSGPVSCGLSLLVLVLAPRVFLRDLRFSSLPKN